MMMMMMMMMMMSINMNIISKIKSTDYLLCRKVRYR
jgi:hypothetical protein